MEIVQEKFVEIPRNKFQNGIESVKNNISNFLDSAEILIRQDKLDHANILTEFSIEELGKILMLKDEYEKQKSDPVKIPRHILKSHKGKSVECDLRLDLLVENLIIVELKAVERMISLYEAQLLTYLKLLKKPKGLLINFNTNNITKSLIPMVTDEFSKLIEA